MLVNLKEVMAEAIQGGYAVGAFNVTGLESLMAIIQAAEETKKAVIISYAEVHSPLISIEIIGPLMLEFAKQASVPVCVHLDHGSGIERCMQAMRLGFTSVMIDASAAEYEANVALTAEVVKWAHTVNVTVEAELGHIFSADVGVENAEGGSDKADYKNVEDAYTDPETARDFVEKTGIDALAIAFGTAHGIYASKPVLDLARIKLIKEAVDIPFVMHGGSGLSKEEFQTAIGNGVRKINYYTYMTMIGARAVKDAMDQVKEGENIFYHDIPGIGLRAMKEDVKKAIQIFSLEI